MTENPLVSCVVVAYHRPDALAALLGRLNDPRIEVVVMNVENDSDVAGVGGSCVVPLEGNPGYATAVNAGSRRATAPVVVFLNDDVKVRADHVLALAALVSSGRADVALPLVVDGQGRREPTIAALPSPANLFREWFLLPDRAPGLLRGWTGGVEKWRSPIGLEVIDAAAATVVATSAAWLRRVPLPEDYFLYWEESEWFWHLKAAGARVVYDPGVVVGHSGGRDDVRPAKSRLLARNAVRCVRRTQGRRAAVLAWMVVILWNLRLVVVEGIRRVTGSAGGTERLHARTVGLRAALVAWREL